MEYEREGGMAYKYWVSGKIGGNCRTVKGRCVRGAWGCMLCMMKSEKGEEFHMLPLDVKFAAR